MSHTCSLVFMWVPNNWSGGSPKSCCLHVGYIPLPGLLCLASVGKDELSSDDILYARSGWYPGMGRIPSLRRRGVNPVTLTSLRTYPLPYVHLHRHIHVHNRNSAQFCTRPQSCLMVLQAFPHKGRQDTAHCLHSPLGDTFEGLPQGPVLPALQY